MERCIKGLGGGRVKGGNRGKSKEVIGRIWVGGGEVEGVKSGKERKRGLESGEKVREEEND